MGQAGSIWVKLGLSDADFAKGLKQTESRLNSFGNRLGSIGSRLISGFSIPMGLAAGYTVKLGAELEQTKIAFEVMTGSAEEAGKMVSNLQRMAAKTPFETRDLVQNAQTLMLYGVEAKKVQPILKMLGDISAGNAEKLGLLTYAYSQIQSQGRLIGQDLRQLVNAGFNPLQIISEKTGQSMESLKTAMENGQISADQVTQAFIDATSAGGRFFNMMDRQSQTTAGKFSTLKDNAIIALTNIGAAFLPVANKMIDALMPISQSLQSLANWFGQLPPYVQDSMAAILAFTITLGPLLKGLQFAIGGFSGLIGFMRMLPNLKLASFFADIGIYIGGAIKGAWSLSTALGALSSSFAPFLAGGAIVGGLFVLVDLFFKMAENARIAKLEIGSIKEISDAEKKRQQISEELTLLSQKKQAASGQDTSNGWLAAGIGSWTKEDQARFDDYKIQLKAINDQITILKSPATTNSSETLILGLTNEVKNLSGTWEDYIAGIKQQNQWDAYQKLIDQGSEPGKALFGTDSSFYRMMEDARRQEITSMSEATDRKAESDAEYYSMMEDARKQEIESIIKAGDEAESFKNKLSNVGELLGVKLQQRLGSFGDFLANIKNGGMSLLNSGLDLVFEKSKVLADVFATLGEGVSALVDAVLGAAKNLLGTVGMSAGVGAGAGFLLGGPLGALIGGTVGLLGGILGNNQRAQEQRAKDWENYLQTTGTPELFTKFKEISSTVQALQSQDWAQGSSTLQAWVDKFNEISEAIKTALRISESDLTGVVKNAFGAENISGLKQNIYEGVFTSLRSAMIDMFSQTAMMQGFFKQLSDSMMMAVSDGVLQAEEKTGISLIIDQISTKSTEFYSILDQLGLGMKGLTGAVNQTSASILNAPEGFRVQSYRYTATSLSAPELSANGNQTITININGQDAYTTWMQLAPILRANNVIGSGSPGNYTPAYAG